MHGNVSSRGSRARRARSSDRRIASAMRSTRRRARSRKLPAGDFTYPLTIDNDDSAMVMYLQGANESFARTRVVRPDEPGAAQPVLQRPAHRAATRLCGARDTVGAAPRSRHRVRRAEPCCRHRQGARRFADIPHALPQRRSRRCRPTNSTAYKQGLIGRLRETRQEPRRSQPALLERPRRRLHEVRFARTDRATDRDRSTRRGLLAFYDRLLELAQKQRLVIYSRGKFDDGPAGNRDHRRERIPADRPDTSGETAGGSATGK